MGYEVDFLPVGDGQKSGDAITLRFGNLHGPRDEQVVIVIDGGFSETGEKLVEHIQAYYKTDRVDVVVSTHPDADHTNGLFVVLESMRVGALLMHQPWNHAKDIADLFKCGRVTDQSVRESLRRSLDAACDLEQLAKRKGIKIIEPFAGVAGWNGAFRILGPTQQYYESLLPHFRGTPEPKQPLSLFGKAATGIMEAMRKLAEHWDVETLSDEGETSPENNTSAIALLNLDGRSVFFTGDAGTPALDMAADRMTADGIDRSTLRFVQVPHHGSRRNVGPTLLNKLIGPKLVAEEDRITAFVSCSNDGAPKHPSKQVSNAFRRRGAPVHATQGTAKRHHHDAPTRPGWSTSTPLPFYFEVEEPGE